MQRLLLPVSVLFCLSPLWAQLASGPPLPHRLVPDWAKLPPGWNFGECTGVDVDRNDNVWVFNRGPHKVIQFDKDGRMLRAWSEVPVVSSHGLRLDPDGDVWLVDAAGHALLKCDTFGRVRMVIANPSNRAGNNESKYGFNQPTGLSFTPTGDFYVADGYVNSRVVKYSKDGEYLLQWGKKGTGDGEFDLVHDVAVDKRGRVYVADRTNGRLQVFDASGKFITKWAHAGVPWGLRYVEREDALYMCDGANNRVLKLDPDGKVLGVLGSFGKATGKFDFAHNITVDSTGAIYVVEIKNWRVQKFAVPETR